MPDKQDESLNRGQWSNKIEFILSCIGYSVGLGNVWRFPYQAYQYGGAAFLFAYLILQFLIGKPMYFMELTLGQYSARGPTGVWTINPCARGVGIAMAIISIDIAIYYNVIIAYIVYFFVQSFRSPLPWTYCDPEWADCIENAHLIKKMKFCNDTSTTPCVCHPSIARVRCSPPLPISYSSPAQSFFDNMVTKMPPTFDSDTFGTPIWYMTLCLMASWVVVTMCLIKGVKSTGKVVYFTATFPYVVLLILLVVGCLQEGAIDGIKFFIVPDWKKLGELRVWTQAAGQMFFSLGLTMGGITMYGSYNNFKNNVFRDAMIIAGADVMTSVIAGFVIFSNLGGLAYKKGVKVEDVSASGFALAFIVYPEALSNIQPPQLWSIIFFLMFFTLGLDSEFALIETVLTSIQDEWPQLRRYKSFMVITTCFILFLLELPIVCPGGIYVMTMFDHYGGDISLLIVGFFETIAVSWVYGVNKLKADVEFMLGKAPSPWLYWASCLAFFAPVGILVLFLYRVIEYEPPRMGNSEFYPSWAQTVGFCLMGFTVSPIPLWFAYSYYKATGSVKERLKQMTDSSEWVPAQDEGWVRPKRGETIYEINADNEPSPSPPPAASQPAEAPSAD